MRRRHRRDPGLGGRAGPRRRRASRRSPRCATSRSSAAQPSSRAARYRRACSASLGLALCSLGLFGSAGIGSVGHRRACCCSSACSCSARCSRAARELGDRRAAREAQGHHRHAGARERRPQPASARRRPAAALMIGVSLVGFITVFAASAKQSFSAAIDEQINDRLHHQQRSGSFGRLGAQPDSSTSQIAHAPRDRSVDAGPARQRRDQRQPSTCVTRRSRGRRRSSSTSSRVAGNFVRPRRPTASRSRRSQGRHATTGRSARDPGHVRQTGQDQPHGRAASTRRSSIVLPDYFISLADLRADTSRNSSTS